MPAAELEKKQRDRVFYVVLVINVAATIYFIVIYRSALMLLFYRLLGVR